ncbi:MAG: PilZ domain-containing protein [Planctomycetota bacterium]
MVASAPRSSNRRRESRYRTLTGQRVSWAPSMSIGGQRKGWVLDVSHNGMGVMMERRGLPQVGETLAVRLRPSAEPVTYEVVRVQPGDQKIVVVGLERVYGKPSGVDLPDPAWAQAA